MKRLTYHMRWRSIEQNPIDTIDIETNGAEISDEEIAAWGANVLVRENDYTLLQIQRPAVLGRASCTEEERSELRQALGRNDLHWW